MATTSLEDVARDVGGDLWFQLYVWRDRGLIGSPVKRAAASGYRTLIVCIDTPVTGLRVRNTRNGFPLPQLTPSAVMGMAAHPAWCISMLKGAPITFANFDATISARSESVMERTAPALVASRG